MACKSVEVAQREVVARQELRDDPRHIAFDKRRNAARETRFQAVLLDVPAHDVERMRPGVFSCRRKERAVTVAGDDCACRAIAKQCGRDEVAFVEVVATKGKRAQLDNEEQHIATRFSLCEIPCTRKAGHATGAAKPENGQAPDVATQLQAFDQQRVQAGCRNARGRNHDDRVYGVARKICIPQTRKRDLLQKVDRALEIYLRAIFPAMRVRVPVYGHAGIAPPDAGIFENGQQAIYVMALSEQRGRVSANLRLI